MGLIYMDNQKQSKINAIDIILLFLFFILSAAFYIGFFFPDPYLFNKGKFPATIISLFLKLFIPVFFIFVIIIYYKARTNKIKISNVLLILASIIFIFLLLNPIISLIYEKSSKMKNKDQYHPYLQLMPQALDTDLDKKYFKIVCLGGSTTEYKNSAGIGWPDIVEKELRVELNRQDIKIYNQGRQWYTTLHSLINYQANVRPMKPDIIIIMHTINDLLQNADFSYFSQREFRLDYGHFNGPVYRIIRQESMIDFASDIFHMMWYHKNREIIYQDKFKGEVSFEQNLNTIIDLAKLDGTKVVLLTQPSLYKISPDPKILPHLYMLNNEAIGKDKQWAYETALNGFQRYKEIIIRTAKKRSAYFIDMDAVIPKTLDYFYDDVHYTDTAYELFANKLTEGLIGQRVIKQ
jgi:lysophospholipase L1-like esterase